MGCSENIFLNPHLLISVPQGVCILFSSANHALKERGAAGRTGGVSPFLGKDRAWTLYFLGH